MDPSVAALFSQSFCDTDDFLLYCTSLVHRAPREPGLFFSRRIRSYRYDFKSSQMFRLRRKKEKKEMYFKKLGEKKGNIFSAHYKLHLLTLHISSFFSPSFARKNPCRRIHSRSYSILFPEKRLLEFVSLPTRYNISATFIRTIYISSILSCPRTLHPFLSLSLSLLFSFPYLSTKSIYLFTFSVVHSSASILIYGFMVLRYIHLSWRARGERERDVGPIKKIIIRFRGTPNFDAPRFRRRTGAAFERIPSFLSFFFLFKFSPFGREYPKTV